MQWMQLNQDLLKFISARRDAIVVLADALGWRAHVRPSIAEWVDDAGASADYFVRFSLHNSGSHGVTIDSATIMMGDEALLPLSSNPASMFDVVRLPLHLAAGSSESFDLRPTEVANLVVKHGGRGKVILHGVCQLQDGRHVNGRPMLFDVRFANSPPFKGSLAAQSPRARVWAWLSNQYPRAQIARRIGLAERVLYVSYQEMLVLRQKADTRDLAGSMYRGQPILDFSMWRTGDVSSSGFWRAAIVLADRSRIELVEDRS
jgi:hypothetical protein